MDAYWHVRHGVSKSTAQEKKKKKADGIQMENHAAAPTVTYKGEGFFQM